MRSYLILTTALLTAFPFVANAQLNKHDQSIANHSYNVPIIVHDTPVLTKQGRTLRDDVEKGVPMPAPMPALGAEAPTVSKPMMPKVTPPAMPEAVITTPAAPTPNFQATTPTIPPAMPPAIGSDLEEDVDQLMEKKTLDNTVTPQSNTKSLDVLAKNALNEGDFAKDFNLKSAKGETVDFFKELEKGPVVLIWYRGGWCPYCNIQLKAFQDKLDTIEAAGAQLIAISPELPDNSLTTAQKNDLNFQVLSDTNNDVAREYGLAYTAPDDLKEKLPDLNLMEHNGTTNRDLPLTATYVIETDGKIAYASITPDYRERAQPADVITVLGDINARESIKKSRIRQAMEREAKKVDLKNDVEIPAVIAPVAPVLPEARLDINPPLPDDIQETKDEIGEKIDQLKDDSGSRIEKLEDKTTIKTPDNFKTQLDLKPMVVTPPAGVDAETTLEVRAKEEGLVPESY